MNPASQCPSSFEAKVDLSIYSRTALLKVAHKFIGTCAVSIESEEGFALVRLEPLRTGIDVDAQGKRFLNELLDQTLREEVAKETEPVRNLILAHALSELPLLGQDLDVAEPFDDPEGIFLPDSEKPGGGLR